MAQVVFGALQAVDVGAPEPAQRHRQAQVPEHVVERAVLHHQHDDVIDVREQSRVGQRRVRRRAVALRQHRALRRVAGERQRDARRRLARDLEQVASEQVVAERVVDRAGDLAQLGQAVVGGVREVVGAADEALDERGHQRRHRARDAFQIDVRAHEDVGAVVGAFERVQRAVAQREHDVGRQRPDLRLLGHHAVRDEVGERVLQAVDERLEGTLDDVAAARRADLLGDQEVHEVLDLQHRAVREVDARLQRQPPVVDDELAPSSAPIRSAGPAA